MKRFCTTYILVTSLITLASAASINLTNPETVEEIPEIFSENCLDGNNCTENEKTLAKRNIADITLEDVNACNKSRIACISKCQGSWECKNTCPVCPELHFAEELQRIIVEETNGSFIRDLPIIRGHNITTIIKLLNLINNTNLIDIPTNVNLTNQNHVHVYQNDSSEEGGEFGLGYNRFGSCCYTVEPRTCTPTSKGYSCHHKRHKTCGQQCTARVIHAERRQRCHGHGSHGCVQKVSYIPQPKKPICSYTHKWPFVVCGKHRQQSCHGCYQHYGYGAKLYYGGHVPSRCHACYDDAFNIGPLYRRGPVLKPFYYHQAPCYLTGTCQNSCNMYGCYGHEYVDPSWGYMQNYMGHMPMQYPNYANYHYAMPEEEFEEDDLPFEIRSQISNGGSGYGNDFDETEDSLPHIPDDGADWAVERRKCRSVDNNGTLMIKNCTDTERERNPFASSPSVYPHIPERTIYEDQNSFAIDDDYETYEGRPHPSDYEGYQRTQWDHYAEIPRVLQRRHSRPQRKHTIIYDE